MLSNYLQFLLLASLCHSTTTEPNDQVEPSIDFGSFKNPSARLRPRFRYWIPDASVDLETVAADIGEIGRIGAGGAEVLGYYEYGAIGIYGDYIPTDWTKYGWGTPAWREVQDTALRATKDNDLVIDLAIGGNQAAGVPAPYEDEGRLWDIQPFNISIPIGSSYSGILPGWGAGELAAAVTATVMSTRNSSSGVVTSTLSEESLADVTALVTSNGSVSVTFDSSRGERNILFAYYLFRPDYREIQTPSKIQGVPQSGVQHWVQNGSWVVDHFSARGAETVAKFWNDHLLNGSDSTNLLREVGNYIWEDSVEFPANLFWTPSLPAAFQAKNNYSILSYLPVLLGSSNGNSVNSWRGRVPRFVTDAPDQGDEHNLRYRQMLTELYGEYLSALTDFAQSLGVQSSAQPAYGDPMNMLEVLPLVNAPEGESLGFQHNIDIYRQLAGPSNLAGKRVISSELGAGEKQAYQLPIPELLWDVKRSIVGGINNFVFHGTPYSGWYANTTWPGYTTFSFMYADMHGPRQPGWEYYKEAMDYTARLQYVAQSGVPKIDLAFLHEQSSYQDRYTVYGPMDLIELGFSYEYLAPANLNRPEAFVSEGVFAPDRQGFKAIIVRANETITQAALAKVAEYANQGLPVVLSGGLPRNVSALNTAVGVSANETLQTLQQAPNVHIVPATDLAQSLLDLEIGPRTAYQKDNTKSTWYTLWRARSDGSETLVFVYNDASGLGRDGGASYGNITLETTGTPYVYDAWTGEQRPILQYIQDQTSTTIPISLAGNQSTIIAFKHTESTFVDHIEQWDGKVQVRNPTSSPSPSRTVLACLETRQCQVQMASGRELSIPAAPEPIQLSNWTLTIESWSPPGDLSKMLPADTVKRNTTYSIRALLPWNQLQVANLTSVSGRGFYKTTFFWPSSSPSNGTSGAIIDLGAIVHTAVVYINGHKTPPLDPTAAEADITALLRPGLNEVEVIVSTPLGNALIPIWNDVRSAGNAARTDFWDRSPTFAVAEYGLVGEVFVRPYVGVAIGQSGVD